MPEGRFKFGAFVGMLIFLAGVALLGVTFYTAWQLFQVRPEDALNLKPDKPLNLNETGVSLLGVVYRIAMLLVMCIVGSVIANRGIKLFAASGGMLPQKPSAREPE